jgi:hypothetical protein
MTLKNLLGISLDAITPDKALLAKLLAAAQRNIDDANLRGLSTENRFDAAYKAIMQSAMVAETGSRPTAPRSALTAERWAVPMPCRG